METGDADRGQMELWPIEPPCGSAALERLDRREAEAEALRDRAARARALIDYLVCRWRVRPPPEARHER